MVKLLETNNTSQTRIQISPFQSLMSLRNADTIQLITIGRQTVTQYSRNDAIYDQLTPFFLPNTSSKLLAIFTLLICTNRSVEKDKKEDMEIVGVEIELL